MPAALAEIVARMMHKDVSQRYESIEQAMKDLRKAFGVQRRKGGRAGAAARAGRDGEAATETARVPVEISADGRPAEALALPTEGAEPSGEERTAAIPKVPMSPRTKLILAISAGVLAITAGIVVAVVLRGRGAARESQAAALYQAATSVYQEAGKAYFNGDVDAARAGYQEALGKYQQFVSEFDDVEKGLPKAKARAFMCQGQLAMLSGAWTAADTACEEAKKLKVLDLGETKAFLKEKTVRKKASAYLTAAENAIKGGQYDTAREQLAQFDSLEAPPVDLRNGRRVAAGDSLLAAETDSRTRQLIDEGDEAVANLTRNLNDFQRRLLRGDAALSSLESSLNAAELAKARDDIKDAREKYKAVGLPDAVRDRLGRLKAAEGYIAALIEYGRATSDANLAPLKKRQVQIANVVVIEDRLRTLIASGMAIGGPTSYGPFVDMLKGLRAEEAYERGMTLSGAERKQAFEESLTYKKLPKVVAALATMQASANRGTLLAEANRLNVAGKYAELVALLEASPITAQDAELTGMLADAKVNLHLAAGDAARKDKRWDDALMEYEKARLAKPGDATVIMEVERRTAALYQEREFYTLLAKGRDLLEAKQYKQAVETLAKAETVAQGLLEAPKAEATRLKTQGRYEWALADGHEALASNHLEDARAHFLRAQRHIQTPEVAVLIADVEQALKDWSP